ncbi:MAG: UDP-N-acetylglucosamine 1-carboxyvinyltransferase, partial [bacterium]|nr:UDP-N-acetylglucosamine 1-carboxyvinyltransferase [bacterium]
MIMRIEGGHHLRGRVRIMGAKNAIGPLIAATLLVKGECVFKNVPRLTDVFKLLEILEGMGAKVVWTEEHTLAIDTKDVDPEKLDKKKMKSMRFSILLLGPLLARFKKIVVPEPGGCSIGNRPIDEHIAALAALGAHVTTDASGCLFMHADALKGQP